MSEFDFDVLPRVNEQAKQCSATIRQQASHFQVEEVLPFEPEGSGGHIYLQIRKTGENTDWVAKQLAKFANVAPVAVGFAGLKDRHAVTTQWFSVNVEGVEEPDWALFETDSIKIVQQTRHNKKLKRGVLSGNRFKLVLTALTGEKQDWLTALEQVKKSGFPNYFAEQRFGHRYNNLNAAARWFTDNKKPKKRNQVSIVLSAARSWLFNLVLAERIEQNNWNQLLTGELALLAGTKSGSFIVDDVTAELEQRCATFDIDPSAVMWGRGESRNQASSLALEDKVLEEWQTWQQGLEKAKVDKAYRSLRVMPQDFDWQFEGDDLIVSLFLPSGSYATALLRELAVISDAQHRNYND